MNLVRCQKKFEIRHVIKVIYSYKIDHIICRVMSLVLKNKRLKDIIMIESHNDFDCNGGAFYDFLIKNGYNKKYKIIWLLKHPERKPKTLPENVECYPLFKPNIKKDYYNVVSKYFTADNTCLRKQNPMQKSFFFSHGCGGLKNIKGEMRIPDDIDYILIQSEKYARIQAEQYSIPYPSERLVYLGYPTHDVLHDADGSEIKKVTNHEFNKIIIWMPTFRKGAGRNDSIITQNLGIPLIETLEQYEKLNQFMKENNSLLIIKLHPMQDLLDLKIRPMSNITVLTGEDVKSKNIDNYRLLPCTDALISDYSGIAYEYLQLNKPIAYVLSDMKEYKLGFVVEDIDSLLAGPKIFNYDDLIDFISKVVNNKDEYKKTRLNVKNFIYKYNDGNSCKRIADFMGLIK